jgi:LacI family transcriptional regulator
MWPLVERESEKGQKDRPIRLLDIAERAGVSLATASRVLNGSPDRAVGEPHRSLVLNAAAELNYTPNFLAQAVAKGASNLIGLVVQDITDPYFSSIAAGVNSVADDAGMVVVLADAHNDPDREVRLLRSLRAQQVRAIVLAGSRRMGGVSTVQVRQEIAAFEAAGGSFGYIGQDRLGVRTVAPENHLGASALAKALVESGLSSFVVLRGPPTLMTAAERTEGFLEGLLHSGVPETSVATIEGPFTRDGGFQSAKRMLDLSQRPSCVFAVNDVMAVGAMSAIREAGLRIPHDIGVAGFDDIATLRDVAPPLSTVRLPLREMGEWVTLMVVAPGIEPQRVRRVEGEVILRASTSTPVNLS